MLTEKMQHHLCSKKVKLFVSKIKTYIRSGKENQEKHCNGIDKDFSIKYDSSET